MSKMRLEFQITPADIKETLAPHRSRIIQVGRGMLGWVVFFAVVTLLFIWFRQQNRSPVRQQPPPYRRPIGAEWLLAIVPWLLMIAFICFFVIRNIRGRAETLWKKDPRWQQPKTAELTDEGLRISDSMGDIFVRWPYFVAWAETDNLLLLVEPDEARVMIPKRAARNESELNALRHFIADRVAPLTMDAKS